ncbi:MAG: hypothetical protein KDB69_06065 [Acidimicrobiia bacterium]|nr:hypothetical protein [Acidimicrobiia bacterium]
MHRRFVTLVAAVAFVATACTPGGGTDATSTTDQAPTSTTASSTSSTTTPPDGFGGTVRVGVDAEPGQNRNPYGPSGLTSATIEIGNAIWATVFDVDPVTFEKVPDTVLALPTQSPDAIETHGDGSMTVRYQVNPAARWSDGVPISGEDIAFTADVLKGAVLAGDPNIPEIMGSVVDTEALEQVAWITFSHTSLTFEDALRVILPAHAIGDGDPFGDVGDWPSGGPFLVTDDPLRYERNNFYWKTDDAGRRLPYLDELVFVPTLDGPADAIRSSSVDLVTMGDPSGVVTNDTDLEVSAVPTPVLEHLTFGFGSARDEVNGASSNDIPAYRRAVATVIDRPTLLEAVGVPWDPETPGVLIPRGESAWNRYGPSERDAASLIGELDTDPVAVISTSGNAEERPAIVSELVDVLRGIDVDATADLQDSLVLFQDTLPNGAFDIAMWAWINDGSYGDVLRMLGLFDPASDTTSFSRWGVEGPTANDAAARFSEIAALAPTIVDVDEFWSLVGEAEGILADQVPIIPLFHRTVFVVIAHNRVTGVVPNASRSGDTWNVELWQVPGE